MWLKFLTLIAVVTSIEAQNLRPPFYTEDKIPLWEEPISMAILDTDLSYDKNMYFFASSLIYSYAQARQVMFLLSENEGEWVATMPQDDTNFFFIVDDEMKGDEISNWITSLQEEYMNSQWLQSLDPERVETNWATYISNGDNITCGAYVPYGTYALGLAENILSTNGALIFQAKKLDSNASADCIEAMSALAFGVASNVYEPLATSRADKGAENSFYYSAVPLFLTIASMCDQAFNQEQACWNFLYDQTLEKFSNFKIESVRE